jgi:hypothetical protein
MSSIVKMSGRSTSPWIILEMGRVAINPISYPWTQGLRPFRVSWRRRIFSAHTAGCCNCEGGRTDPKTGAQHRSTPRRMVLVARLIGLRFSHSVVPSRSIFFYDALFEARL